ncbi:MAG: DUF1932 domain-containing protein [Allosphingosinicella sp.]
MSANVSLIGFGEAAMAFALDWAEQGVRVRAYDLLTDDPATAEAKRADYRRHGVEGCDTLADCLAGAETILSLVTADQALAAAEAAASCIGQGAFYVDCNSAAPQTKRAAAEAIGKAGAAYVDAAIMAPVEPQRTKVPLLLSGPRAEEGRERLAALGFAPEIAGDRIGQAATIKMLRSVIVKGIEALTAECFLAAEAEGVAEAVAASLGAGWRDKADYNLDRMMVHGTRRAAEMEAVAATLEALGFPADMARAAAGWQRRIGALGIAPEEGLAAKAAQIARRGRKDAA